MNSNTASAGVREKALALDEQGVHLLPQDDASRALALAEKTGDVRAQAACLTRLAHVMEDEGNPAGASLLLQRALRLREALDDTPGRASVLHELADVLAQQGELVRAQGLWQQAFELRRALGLPGDLALTAHALARVTFQLGDPARGHALRLEAMRLFAQANQWNELISVLATLEDDGTQEVAHCLAQGLWLSFRIPEVPVDAVLALTEKVVRALPSGSGLASLLATTAWMLLDQSRRLDPRWGALASRAWLLVEARGAVPERDLEGLRGASREGLERLMGTRDWLFPHHLWPA